MRFIRFILTLIIIIFPLRLSVAQDLTAKQIVAKADEHFRGESSVTALSMTIVKPEWSRTIEMKTWSKGRDRSLILLTAPARDEGTTFLMRGNEVWNWIPSIERVIKIPPSMMMQSWMGSDFTNDDLVKESSVVEDYSHRLLADSTIEGRNCYVVELTPKPDAAVVWGKLLVWITKENFLQLKIEYYDEDGKLMNIMTLSEIKPMGDRIIPTKLVMQPADKPDQRTIMIYKEAKFNLKIEDSFFSEQNMKRVRA